MKYCFYDILDFVYKGSVKTFYAFGKDLRITNHNSYITCRFPSRGKKFTIRNFNTFNQHAFVLLKETKLYYVYQSCNKEYKCIILKKWLCDDLTKLSYENTN